ncbi:SRPBCC family protein [Gracilimonas halophila]|uniref:SRPBCC family protein n=1 Tax=Gracilimonas halophila TaxID=1834464 RepID=A0ABW5JN73_9BACT
MNKKYGVFTEPGTVQFELLLPGPAERIWEYLTKSELKAKWLSAGDVEPKVGGRVSHYFDHKTLSEEDDPIPEKYANLKEGDEGHGKVTAYDPPRLLSYTWVENEGQSEVTFELLPQDDGNVKLILTHRNLGDDIDVLSGVGAGWHTHVGILIDVLNGKKPRGFWKVHMPLEKEYERMLNNQV